MAQKDKPKAITIKGTAYWAHVVTPETYDGKEIGYSIQVELDEERQKKLIKYLEQFWEENKPDGKMSPKVDPNLPFIETDDGNIRFKAKTKHEYKAQDGTMQQRYIPIFQADGTPLPKGTLIGNGSKVQVNVTPATYRVSQSSFGVTLYLNAVLVEELVEYGVRDASSYGFEYTPSEDGEEADEDMEF